MVLNTLNRGAVTSPAPESNPPVPRLSRFGDSPHPWLCHVVIHPLPRTLQTAYLHLTNI